MKVNCLIPICEADVLFCRRSPKSYYCINVVMKARDRRWSWLGRVLRMPEHRLVRQVLLNCAKPTHKSLFADVPNLSIESATKMAKDRKLWSSNRPSLRYQPLSGGVAIK